MKNLFRYSLILVMCLYTCLLSGDINSKRITIPPYDTLMVYYGVNVINGGFGSSLVVDPYDSSCFYILTDRGPCVNSNTSSDTKIFVVPTFTPLIGKFKLENDSLRLISVIELKDEHGNNLTGLPDPVNSDENETIIKDLYGNVLEKDSLGIDPEGLAALPDKSFWVSDEYGPDLVHFDSTGKTIERINPRSSAGRSLPKVFARREPNGGMEGLTVTPDGKTLVGAMQAPLYNPSKSEVNKSLVTRLLFFNIQTGATKQYVYLLEATNTNVSEIAAITDTTFLVLERDGDFMYGSPNSKYKSVYKININGASDISDPSNGISGKMINHKTIEELEDDSTLILKHIIPVKKTLVANLFESNYYHDKPEGLAIINNNTIAISNDDDFGIESDDNYQIASKKVPTDSFGKFIDYNELLILSLEQPLIDPATSVKESASTSPHKYILEQNYPNPFNPVTEIYYRLPGECKVKIRIYNIIGECVKELVNETKQAGAYCVSFNAGNLSSGVYFYQLITNDFIQTKKMVLLK